MSEPAETSSPELTVVEPVQVDSQRVVLIGTIIWGVALVVLLAMWTWLGEHDHRDWLWTAVAGTVLGLLGLILTGRHRREGRTR